MHEVLKPFAFSRDGIYSQAAAVGEHVDLPEHLVPGLVREGFVRHVSTKAIAAAPENKVIESAPENKGEAAAPSVRRGRRAAETK